MINDQILGYIKSEQAKGSTLEVIKKNLIDNGWTSEDVDEAYRALSISYSMGVHSNDNKVPTPLISQNQQPTSKRKNKIILPVLIIFFFLLIGGGYAYGNYIGYFTPLSKILADAITSAKNAKSASFDFTGTLDAAGLNTTTMEASLFGMFSSKSASLTVKGSYDIVDSKNIKSEATISLDAGIVAGELEYKMLDSVLYAKVNKLPTMPFLVEYSKYLNNWYSYSIENEEGINMVKQMAMSSPLEIGVELTDKLDEEQKEEILKISENASLFKVTERMSTEEINGVSCYHFKFGLDENGIRNYLYELKNYINTVGKSDSYLSSFEPLTAYEEAMKNIKNISGEAWVGKSDSFPYKIMISFDVDMNQIQENLGLIKISIVSVFKDWNKPRDITAPENSKTFEQLFKEISDEQAKKYAPVTTTKTKKVIK